MSHTPIRLGDAQDFVEIRALEHGAPASQSDGDLRLGVAVRMDGFAGEYDQVWIAKDDWASFLVLLRGLERDRSGRATLTSMSPEEFELHLEIVDRAGHLAAHGRLSRYHFGHPSGNATRSCIEYHVGVDPSLLRDLVGAFAALGLPSA